jgi:hypothetical protein
MGFQQQQQQQQTMLPRAPNNLTTILKTVLFFGVVLGM